MFELAHPIALLALPLPLLSWWLLPPHRERVSALRVPFFAEIVQAAGFEARSGAVVMRRRRLQMIVAAIVWSLLVVALAKPEWVGEPIERTEAARDVMLAIDLSGSMDYRDFPDVDGNKVRRLSAVQSVVEQFISQRDSDRVGLIVFGDKAYLQLPFTRDLQSARQLVRLMDVGMAGPRTAVGDAIGLTIKAFESSQLDDKLLILLTDGNDTASKMTPINAAEIAKINDVEIYTIGVGDPEASGEDRVDFETLKAIAQRTGGQFFDASDETTLTKVYERIDELAVADVKTTAWRPRESMVHWPASAAVILVILAYLVLLLSSRRRRAAA
ncbi:MAG: VWA domain-containing protein [Pseudomonadales bacterium]